jgi:hypothetical protein
MVWGTSRGIDDIIGRLQCQDPTLSKLHLFKARRLNHDDAIKLCDALVSNTIIIELNISSHPIPIEMATVFSEMLAANDSLISLSLGNSSLGDPAFSILCRGIASNRSLRELHFDSKGITHASCQHLATAIAAHGNIQLLSLSHNPLIGTAGIQHLLPYISTISTGGGSSINTLYLENCGLSADISQDLLESCMRSGSLKCLKLSDNKDLFLVLKQGEEQHEEERLVIDSNTTKTTTTTIMTTTSSNYCSIEELHIERCGLDTKSVSTSWLTSSPTFSHTILPHLRYLNISNNSLGSAVGCAFLKLISKKAVHLHTLICCNTDLALREEGGKDKEECDEIVIDTKGDTDNNRDGDSLVHKAVSDHLGGHNTLTTLDLSGNRKSIGATGLQGLSLSPSLVSLTLHDCDLGSQAPLIIEYLLCTTTTTTNSNGNVFFPVLDDIDLSGNDIQKTELLGLLQALKMVKSGDNDNGGDHIFRIAPVLKTLVIAANPGVDDINEEVIGEVQVMRPELVIVRRATDTGEQQSGQQQQ